MKTRRLCLAFTSLAAAALVACGCNFSKTIETPSLGPYYRAADGNSSVYASKVCDYTPAPGQFIGDEATALGGIRTAQAACDWALGRLNSRKFVSLGGFGGYIVVTFDHSIVNMGGDDFAIYCNALPGGSEPGVVYVAADDNGNGIPDDAWYELRGSDTGSEYTLQGYSVTYYRPTESGSDVRWSDSEGGQGSIDYLAAYHSQASYWPEWVGGSEYTLSGTRLKALNYDQSGNGTYWVNPNYGWGYADNYGSDIFDVYTDTSVTLRGNTFRIGNAMNADGSAANLKYIDFIKVQTAVNAKSGWLGELSTEVCGFEDLSINTSPM